ncbi:hypothetical protein [Variovorax sp. OK605]|uniref:hypothetical protein n=1 Tax=Variovorax sp. OK605 TaxID=1855317 RepID=UPI0015A57267|nr:hypothetical protein [Variovorax sp. OK605]
MADSTQTIVVQVQPAPASPENVALYWSMFWAFFAVLVGIWGWKKVQQIFDTNHENS